ncbi:dioxygenase family protein [Amorphus orientalis]|uniref:Protocatechuate 3,4-dioxygenase beta subunit n=1 Tax=Amorphus orientalis TaxID=649198 RepID=A0AAE4ARW9_9HYPH|nr:dioxygenase [Amorphus orientalis]MDQ0314548.1 protocatechuate 3,4-dioxygenase beta subunit [Amorphus orientalis]
MPASTMPTHTMEAASRAAAERFRRADRDPSPFLASAVEHLHALIRETRPSQEDWRAAIEFLTATGHAVDDKRQEWMLLSDVLGVSALVEELNAPRPLGATPNTVRGVFYRADAPRYPLGTDISLDGKGDPLTVRGRVVDLDGHPIAGATVETWQANAQGRYENQEPEAQPEHNLRGVFTTGADGGFHYRTVKPAGYALPDDGPVGALFRRIGCPMRRPAHLHFIIRAEPYETISTHVFDGNDPDLSDDALFGVRPELIGDFVPVCDPSGGRAWALDFTFVMARAKPKRDRP